MPPKSEHTAVAICGVHPHGSRREPWGCLYYVYRFMLTILRILFYVGSFMLSILCVLYYVFYIMFLVLCCLYYVLYVILIIIC